ncbi:MAG: ATP-dependent RecD-like DNA helicase [Prevotella sp.]|nr:ATP-dependent RecD-like DNA helicase [Prevotella sp.]
MVIQGTVSAIVFANEATGYRVLRLDNHLMAVGVAPMVAVGAEYKFVGTFVNNAKHGKQFEFTELTLQPPDSEDKILAFLGGGLLKGVGPATARKIVKKFGMETIAVIETRPQDLTQIRGISPQKAQSIAENYLAVREMQSVMMWLYRFEISLNLSLKIYQQYGKDTIATVAKNPYALIETIDGVGFTTADSMAKKLGVSYNGTFRVRAGVVHILKISAETDGHTYVTLPDLIGKVCHLLRIKMEELTPTFNTIINELCLDRIVVAVDVDGVQGLQLIRFFNAEKAIAQKLLLLMQEPKAPDNVDALIAHYESLQGITFHATQKLAIKQAVTGGVTVITGGPGTGKTTIIKAILYLNRANELSTQMLAPTGRAAKRIEETTGQSAMTIHRCLEKFSHDSQHSFITQDMVIVDEVSMCDCLLTAALLRKILAGTKVVFIGDSDQLPSVGAGNVLADIIASGVVPTIRLTQIYRTGANATIAINAHRINNGEMPILDNQSSDFFYSSAETPEMMKNEILGLCSSRLPQYLGVDTSKVQVLAPMKLGAAGVINLNQCLQAIINPPAPDKAELLYGETIFREGDRVMHTVNNYKQAWVKNREEGKGIFNGDIGKIVAINKFSGEITVELEDGRVTVYPRSELAALTLSYAITVHKSQGCEFDAVVIPVVSGAYMIMTRNLLYTAVTRAKRLVMLVGKQENIQKMVSNTYTKKRNSCLNKYLQYFKDMPY